MANRVPTTSAPAGRRRPHPVVTPSIPLKAARPRRADAGQLELPGAATLLQGLEVLWKSHTALEDESFRLRSAGQLNAADAMAASARYQSVKALAMERVALAFSPATPADAIAQLILVHSEIGTLTSSDGNCEEPVRALLENAIRAVAVLAKINGFDLTALSFQYLTEAERRILRGEVLA